LAATKRKVLGVDRPPNYERITKVKQNEETHWPNRALFSRWVKEAKLALDAHSLAPVAKMLGLSLSTLYTLHTKNNPRKPSDEVLQKLAAFLGRDSRELTDTQTAKPKAAALVDIWPQRTIFKAHLKRYGTANKKTLAVIADELGVRLKHLGRLLYEKERRPSPELLEKAAAIFGTQADIFCGQEQGAKKTHRHSPRPIPADDHGPAGHTMPFRQQWLWEELGLGPSKALSFTIAEDSMEPVLRNGDVVIVDTGAAQNDILEGLWLVRVGSLERVKKLGMASPDQFQLISYNPDYPAVRLDDCKWELVGQVVYRCGRL
jgi:transcriptional regulator with XRE-family HTH domain